MTTKPTDTPPPILSAPVILLLLALLLMLGIAPWIDALFVPGLLLVSWGLVGLAMIPALRIVWPSRPKTGRR